MVVYQAVVLAWRTAISRPSTYLTEKCLPYVTSHAELRSKVQYFGKKIIAAEEDHLDSRLDRKAFRKVFNCNKKVLEKGVEGCVEIFLMVAVSALPIYWYILKTYKDHHKEQVKYDSEMKVLLDIEHTLESVSGRFQEAKSKRKSITFAHKTGRLAD